jgi:hypothetical protein
LKRSIVSATVPRHFNPERKIIVETNVSNFVIAGVLLQYDDDCIFHSVTYFSRKHLPVEINYGIYDKELLTIIRAFIEWCPVLEGSPYTIEVISDHQNLTYFTTNHWLNYHQTH